MTLNEAVASFNHYMRALVKRRHLPHTKAQQNHDLINTELELIDYTKGPKDTDRVPLSYVIDLKAAYKDYLESLYPKQFAATATAAKTITHQLAKKRIKAAAQAHNQEHARSLWKQLKHDFVSHHLDAVTFLDDNGDPVITEQDFNQVLHDTEAYIHQHFKTKKNSKPHGIFAKIKSLFVKPKK